MNKMFCFQCQQTAKNIACTSGGVCGKSVEVANLQDELTSSIIALSMAAVKKGNSENTDTLIMDCLFTTVTNVNFHDKSIKALIDKVNAEKKKLTEGCNCGCGCKKDANMDMQTIWQGDEDVRSLKSLILFGLRGIAAYAHHARVLGHTSRVVNDFFYKGLCAIGEEKDISRLLELVLETGKVNLVCMELLDRANTQAYGAPVPTKVTCNIEKGAFIVVSGHDLFDLKNLLEQTQGKGINVYTHSEMLPGHAYPKLKKYSHLKGNFGTAWQSQQKEFDNIPAPILFTTNCLMPPRKSYADRVFTTSVVDYPEIVHIDSAKDFSLIIAKSLELGGYMKDVEMTGINGGHTLTTGFAHGTVLSIADKIIEAVKSGAIKRFLLVGGCDGAAAGRNYYTDIVKKSPKDTIILTLACGKYRFNDLNIGEIEGIPRILDMGQCNDAYSAIKVASALASVFNCSVSELPLSMVLSWYEQKAVCILLTLLSLGIKDIYLGPTLPAFLSPNVIQILVEKFNIKPTTTADADLAEIMSK